MTASDKLRYLEEFAAIFTPAMPPQGWEKMLDEEESDFPLSHRESTLAHDYHNFSRGFADGNLLPGVPVRNKLRNHQKQSK